MDHGYLVQNMRYTEDTIVKQFFSLNSAKLFIKQLLSMFFFFNLISNACAAEGMNVYTEIAIYTSILCTVA